MSSLQEVLNHVFLVRADRASNHLVDHSKEFIREHLDKCIAPDQVDRYHKLQSAWAYGESRCPELGLLCDQVALHLRSATQRVAVLKSWASGKATLPGDFEGARNLLAEALDDVSEALESFEVVATTESMKARHVKDMAKRYLQISFQIACILLGLSHDPGYFGHWAESIEKTQLRGFIFNTQECYRQSNTEDTTLWDVLSNETPERNYENAEPIFYRSPYSYGPRLLRRK